MAIYVVFGKIYKNLEDCLLEEVIFRFGKLREIT